MPAVPCTQNPDQHPRLSTWRHAPKVSLPRHLNHHSVALCLPTTLSSCGTTLLLSLVMSPLSAGPIFIATGNLTTCCLFPVPLHGSHPSPFPLRHRRHRHITIKHCCALVRIIDEHICTIAIGTRTGNACTCQLQTRCHLSISTRILALLFDSIHPPSTVADRHIPDLPLQEPVCETPLRCGYLF